jgi:hypothetical protein
LTLGGTQVRRIADGCPSDDFLIEQHLAAAYLDRFDVGREDDVIVAGGDDVLRLEGQGIALEFLKCGGDDNVAVVLGWLSERCRRHVLCSRQPGLLLLYWLFGEIFFAECLQEFLNLYLAAY